MFWDLGWEEWVLAVQRCGCCIIRYLGDGVIQVESPESKNKGDERGNGEPDTAIARCESDGDPEEATEADEVV
jgi:hypothetical protein